MLDAGISAAPVVFPIAGLGPHGERAAGPERMLLCAADQARARAAGFTIAVVLHTTRSDWAGQLVAGIAMLLGRYGAAVLEVVDCDFDAAAQVRALDRLIARRPDAIISLPVANAAVAEGHRRVTAAGVTLLLIDNGPSGLVPGRDYVSVISADNFGLGQIGARLLAPHVPRGGQVGILTYRFEFFVAAQREIAFRKQMADIRPDIELVTARFRAIGDASAVTARLLAEHPDLSGIFIVWDTPAIAALEALRACGRTVPVTTVDLGLAIASALAAGPCVKGIGAQQPFDQGVTAATATLAALLGREVPPWIVLPALEVTRERVIASYQTIWHCAAPPELIAQTLA